MFLEKIKHIFGIHKYYEIQKLGIYSHLLGCKYCKKRFAINTSCGILLPWDLELQDFHIEMGHIKLSQADEKINSEKMSRLQNDTD